MAVVGLERTFYQVSEDVGVIEVCAIVYSPAVVCPIEFLFEVNLIIINGSAGKERVEIIFLCNVVKLIFPLIYISSISHGLW